MVSKYEEDMPSFEPIRAPRRTKKRKRGRIRGSRPGDFKQPTSRGGKRTHDIGPSNLRQRLFIPRDPECRAGEIEEVRAALGDRLRHALHIAHKEDIGTLLSRRTLRFGRTSEQEMLARAASTWLGRDVKDSSRLLFFNSQTRNRLDELLAGFGSLPLDCPAPFERLDTSSSDAQLWHFHSGDTVFVCGDTEQVDIFRRALAGRDSSDGGGQEMDLSGFVFVARTGNSRMRSKGAKLGHDSKQATEAKKKAKGYSEADWRRLMQPRSDRSD